MTCRSGPALFGGTRMIALMALTTIKANNASIPNKIDRMAGSYLTIRAAPPSRPVRTRARRRLQMLMKVNLSRSFNVIEAAAAISPATCQEPHPTCVGSLGTAPSYGVVFQARPGPPGYAWRRGFFANRVLRAKGPVAHGPNCRPVFHEERFIRGGSTQAPPTAGACPATP